MAPGQQQMLNGGPVGAASDRSTEAQLPIGFPQTSLPSYFGDWTCLVYQSYWSVTPLSFQLHP